MLAHVITKLALLILLALLIEADDAYDEMPTNCAKKNPNVVNAIGQFCQNTNLIVPSAYAEDGMASYSHEAVININGHCDPPEWVPQHFCLSQFYEMCVSGDALGNNEVYYGNLLCQQWQIGASGDVRSS